VNTGAQFKRRPGKTAAELGNSRITNDDIWQLDNGDIALVGRDVTAVFADRLPPDVRIGDDERLMITPDMPSAAKPDMPDA
jgi:hypothetical protein